MHILFFKLNGTYIDNPISCGLSFFQEDNEEVSELLSNNERTYILRRS